MKLNKFYIVLLVLAGACLGFFGLVYWNTSTMIKQARADELQISQRLTKIETLLAPPQAPQDNKSKE